MATTSKSNLSAARSRKPGAAAQQQRPTQVTTDMIATRAYEIWQDNGCPEGRDMEDWFQAERELRAPHEE